MQCNDGLGRAIEEMSNRTNRANQLMLIFLAQCLFTIFMYLMPIQVAYMRRDKKKVAYMLISGVFTCFLVLIFTGQKARWSWYSRFCMSDQFDGFLFSTLHICKRRTCKFPSRGRECWRAPRAQSSASGSSLQRCGFWDGILYFRFLTFVLW